MRIRRQQLNTGQPQGQAGSFRDTVVNEPYWNSGSVANFAMQDKMHALRTATPQQLLTRVDPATGEATNGIIPYADPRVTGMLRAAAGGAVPAGQPDALLQAKDNAIMEAAKRKAQTAYGDAMNAQADERRNNPSSFMAYVLRNGL